MMQWAASGATYRMPLRTLSAGEQSRASVHDRCLYGRLSMNQPESAIPRSLAAGASRWRRPLRRSMLSRTPVPPALHVRKRHSQNEHLLPTTLSLTIPNSLQPSRAQLGFRKLGQATACPTLWNVGRHENGLSLLPAFFVVKIIILIIFSQTEKLYKIRNLND